MHFLVFIKVLFFDSHNCVSVPAEQLPLQRFGIMVGCQFFCRTTCCLWFLALDLVDSKAMLNSVDAEVSWDATETKDWEALITIIWSNDSTD